MRTPNAQNAMLPLPPPPPRTVTFLQPRIRRSLPPTQRYMTCSSSSFFSLAWLTLVAAKMVQFFHFMCYYCYSSSSYGVSVWLSILLSSNLLHPASADTMSYANVTLTSLGGDLSVVLFLPVGIKPNERTYYYSSRFEHGSMIGRITRTVYTTPNNDNHHAHKETHVLFDSDMWRMPHNSNWPESGIGLASEFGVGDDGAFCFYRCGWSQASDVTNGVLGYREAKNGEAFLKIGVGLLVKGTCPTCDSTDDYKFNSPYLFAEPPKWKVVHITDSGVVLEHEATLGHNGYRLLKQTYLTDNVLSVTTTLTNLGDQAFSTAWYSHNFFTCDANAVGPGYTVDLNLKGQHASGRPLYEEPGTWSWATPLQEYARIKGSSDNIHIDMIRALDPGVRIKTEFVNDGSTQGGFTITSCDTSLDFSLIPDTDNGVTWLNMYAYNLYVERGTFSPEPQILIHLEPGASTTWTQQIVIHDAPPAPQPPTGLFGFTPHNQLDEIVDESVSETAHDLLFHPQQQRQHNPSSLEDGEAEGSSSALQMLGMISMALIVFGLFKASNELARSKRRSSSSKIMSSRCRDTYSSVPDVLVEQALELPQQQQQQQ